MPIRQLKEWWNSPPVKDEPSTPEIMSQPTTEVNQNVSIVKSNAKPKARRPILRSKDISSGSRILAFDTVKSVSTRTTLSGPDTMRGDEPDVIVHIGDHWDMPSLSSYDKKGSRQMEGKRYVKDIDVGNEAMDRFMAPIHAEVARLKKGKARRETRDWSTPWATMRTGSTAQSTQTHSSRT